MSDSDLSGKAWIVSPSEYIERRPGVYGLPGKPKSQYVAMRDGCRLAIDLYLPQRSDTEVPPARLPTIVILTPYYRRFKLRDGAAAATEASPSAVKYRDVFVPRTSTTTRA
jgi:predicted acyl esterase